MEDFIKKIEKLKNQIDSLKNIEGFTLLSFLIKSGKELTEEINSFNEDYSKHRTGVFLWIKEKYPNLLEFLNLISKKRISLEFKVLDRMGFAVNDYFRFIDEVKNPSRDLYKEEISESKNLVFDKTIRPINILRQKSALIDYLLNDLNKNISSYVDPFKDLIKKYTPGIQKGVESYVEKFKPVLGERFELVSKLFKGEITQEQLDSTIQEQDKFLEKIGDEFKQKSKILTNKIEEEKKQIQSETDPLLDKVKVITTLFKEAYAQDPTKLIYEYLLLTKDIDSFNIKFTKFLNRLFHILSFKNRNYKNYYQVGKYHHQERNNLKKFLSLSLKRKYPNLANFLLQCFKYNKFRRLEAHEIPDKIKLLNDNKIAYIPKTGDSPDIQMDIEEIRRVINTYCFFIDAIGI